MSAEVPPNELPKEIRRPVGGPRHDAAAQRVLEDACGLRPGHVVGHERAEVEEDAQAAAVQPRHEVAQDRAREDPPALEPVGAQRDAVAREVTQVLTHLGLVAGRRLAQRGGTVERRADGPARRDPVASGDRRQRGDRAPRRAGGDDVVQLRRRDVGLPDVLTVRTQAEPSQLRAVEQEAVGP
jgi:hypothetical protein